MIRLAPRLVSRELCSHQLLGVAPLGSRSACDVSYVGRTARSLPRNRLCRLRGGLPPRSGTRWLTVSEARGGKGWETGCAPYGRLKVLQASPPEDLNVMEYEKALNPNRPSAQKFTGAPRGTPVSSQLAARGFQSLYDTQRWGYSEPVCPVCP